MDKNVVSESVVTGLLDFLKENKEEDLLPEVVRELEEITGTTNIPKEIAVASVVALEEAQKQKIQADVKKRLGLDLPIHHQIDKRLLGGLTIRVGDWFVDGSVRTELENIKQLLLK